jgi:hypothetical protein
MKWPFQGALPVSVRRWLGPRVYFPFSLDPIFLLAIVFLADAFFAAVVAFLLAVFFFGGDFSALVFAAAFRLVGAIGAGAAIPAFSASFPRVEPIACAAVTRRSSSGFFSGVILS